jgi:hypothetical protein
MSFIMELRPLDQKRLQTGVLECWSIGVMRPTGIAGGHRLRMLKRQHLVQGFDHGSIVPNKKKLSANTP